MFQYDFLPTFFQAVVLLYTFQESILFVSEFDDLL
jgi:hypothetical protein